MYYFVLDEVPVDLVEIDSEKANALHTAVKNGNLNEVKTILSKIEPQSNPIVLRIWENTKLV